MKKVVFSALFVSVLALGAFAVTSSVNDGDKPGKKNKKSCCQSKEANNTSTSGNTKGCCQNKSK